MSETYKNLAKFIRENKKTMSEGIIYYDEKHDELYQIFTSSFLLNGEPCYEDGVSITVLHSNLIVEVDGVKYLVTQK
ncbi:hypothetical protein DW228_06355 [Bacteroides fragilis]|uniref:Uncharacterized protein n=1 Tax=Bacteroides fragilis TaxID=817 RepID=A0A396C1H0_BACFG|nr:hypothetical protein [Bacteroides fragilis]RHH14419.1 hypothetical protein DW228_06355 [Bacteroides fragilis]